HAGVSGFLGNLAELYDKVDEDESAWEACLAAWASAYGDRERKVSEVAADVKEEQHPLRAALPPGLAEALVLDAKGKASFEHRLGQALAKRVDGVFGNLRLERPRKDEHANVNCWRVVKAEPRGFRGFPDFVPPNGVDDEAQGGSTSPPPTAETGRSAGGNPPNP